MYTETQQKELCWCWCMLDPHTNFGIVSLLHVQRKKIGERIPD